MQTVEVCEV